VPHPTDEPDANALPDPELNPLLNPLLAAHMGRWAEVYFTNPPEKRGQAVSELLRELENVPAPEPAKVQVIHDERWKRETERAEGPDMTPAAAEYVRLCSTCAYNNSAGQRFCGMCGAPLQIAQEVDVPQVAEAVPIIGGSWREHELSSAGRPDKYANPTAASGPHDPLEPNWPVPEKEPWHFDLRAEPVLRLRLYLGAVLAILLTMLVYTAWHGKGSLSGPGPQSIPPRAIPAQPAPGASTQQASTTGSALRGRNPAAFLVQNQTKASSRKDQAADAKPALGIVNLAASSTPIAPDPGGAEELATAQKYLKGNQGMVRNSGEAAQWLWKAVGKGNLAATMALSDLYLRGDGVPKSCDQARLLLDAAARKGGTAAAEQLRNLQAFGCE